MQFKNRKHKDTKTQNDILQTKTSCLRAFVYTNL
jgi:hypothetical protein